MALAAKYEQNLSINTISIDLKIEEKIKEGIAQTRPFRLVGTTALMLLPRQMHLYRNLINSQSKNMCYMKL